MIITLDIETRPCDDPELIAEIVANVKPPKTLKKAESIEAWWKEEGEQAKKDAVAKTGTDGSFGRVCCIGWMIDDVVYSSCGEEKRVIEDFFTDVTCRAVPEHYGKEAGTHIIIGHNVSSFDLRFLWQRSAVNGIKRPKSIPWTAKPWDSSIQDTMLLWNPDRDKRISLDNLCKVLGVKSPKGDFDWTMIDAAYKAGEFDRIAEYCKGDVAATYQCWSRMKD